MCQKCVDAVRQYYPQLPEKEWGNFLMGVTCFPFGCGEQVAEQLQRTKRNTDGSVGAAYAYADTEMTMAMAGFDPVAMGM